jgi:hypothetical protein
MSTTTKQILIFGGAGIAAYIVLSASSTLTTEVKVGGGIAVGLGSAWLAALLFL